MTKHIVAFLEQLIYIINSKIHSLLTQIIPIEGINSNNVQKIVKINAVSIFKNQQE